MVTVTGSLSWFPVGRWSGSRTCGCCPRSSPSTGRRSAALGPQPGSRRLLSTISPSTDQPQVGVLDRPPVLGEAPDDDLTSRRRSPPRRSISGSAVQSTSVAPTATPPGADPRPVTERTSCLSARSTVVLVAVFVVAVERRPAERGPLDSTWCRFNSGRLPLRGERQARGAVRARGARDSPIGVRRRPSTRTPPRCSARTRARSRGRPGHDGEPVPHAGGQRPSTRPVAGRTPRPRPRCCATPCTDREAPPSTGVPGDRASVGAVAWASTPVGAAGAAPGSAGGGAPGPGGAPGWAAPARPPPATGHRRAAGQQRRQPAPGAVDQDGTADRRAPGQGRTSGDGTNTLAGRRRAHRGQLVRRRGGGDRRAPAVTDLDGVHRPARLHDVDPAATRLVQVDAPVLAADQVVGGAARRQPDLARPGAVRAEGQQPARGQLEQRDRRLAHHRRAERALAQRDVDRRGAGAQLLQPADVDQPQHVLPRAGRRAAGRPRPGRRAGRRRAGRCPAGCRRRGPRRTAPGTPRRQPVSTNTTGPADRAQPAPGPGPGADAAVQLQRVAVQRAHGTGVRAVHRHGAVRGAHRRPERAARVDDHRRGAQPDDGAGLPVDQVRPADDLDRHRHLGRRGGRRRTRRSGWTGRTSTPGRGRRRSPRSRRRRPSTPSRAASGGRSTRASTWAVPPCTCRAADAAPLTTQWPLCCATGTGGRGTGGRGRGRPRSRRRRPR